MGRVVSGTELAGRDCGIDQNAIEAPLHYVTGIRRKPNARIDGERNIP